ncbi:hypothetical protein ACERK3_09390 [Phycisphaerales bacterium AB-hyl4]|uniref:Uncharacterized protein n=1 Tax=Natronomicrosphaera hydrolytica TaxID=3242702 RepID=A0ABV4U8A4_9BACT
MQSFEDSQGRRWAIDITIGTARRVRKVLNLNLLDPAEGDPPLMTRLDTDVMLFVDVLYLVVQEQATNQNVSDEAFGAGLSPDAVADARRAFWETLSDFFHKTGRADLVRAIAKQQALVAEGYAAAGRRIDQIQTEALVRRIETASIDGSSSASSPPSPASTPTA